jgi:hypothetical protein
LLEKTKQTPWIIPSSSLVPRTSSSYPLAAPRNTPYNKLFVKGKRKGRKKGREEKRKERGWEGT